MENPYASLPGGGLADPYAELDKPSEFTRAAIDVGKQLGAGLVTGTEAIPAFPARVAGAFVGREALEQPVSVAPWEQYLRSYIPGLTREAPALSRRELMEQAQSRGMASYLPEPETPYGQFARTGAEFVPGMATGGLRPAAGTLAQTLVRDVPVTARHAGAGFVTGLTSEAAGQAFEGTPYEPYARGAAALVAGPAATRAAERSAARAAVPLYKQEGINQAKDAAGQLYDQFRAAGFELRPQAAPIFSDALGTALARQGMTPTTAEKTFKVLQGFKTKPFTSPQQYHEAYEELGQVARSTPSEAFPARIAQEQLLSFLENMPSSLTHSGGAVAPAEAHGLLLEANANYAAAKRAENVNARIVKGELAAAGQGSGLGLENELRRRLGVLGRPPEAMERGAPRGFTEEERQAFRDYETGTGLQNLRRWGVGALGGRGGIAVPLALGGGSLAGAGLANLVGADPYTYGGIGGAAPAVGTALALLGNRRALAGARDLERMVLARAPIFGGRFPEPRVVLPTGLPAPTLATLGEPRRTPEGYPYYQGQ